MTGMWCGLFVSRIVEKRGIGMQIKLNRQPFPVLSFIQFIGKFFQIHTALPEIDKAVAPDVFRFGGPRTSRRKRDGFIGCGSGNSTSVEFAQPNRIEIRGRRERRRARFMGSARASGRRREERVCWYLSCQLKESCSKERSKTTHHPHHPSDP